MWRFAFLLLERLLFNERIDGINPSSLNSQNPACCLSDKAASACPI